MKDGMDRREFLKYSAATGVLIAAGEGMIENVMGTGHEGYGSR